MLLGTEDYHNVNFGTLEYWIHLQIPMEEAFKYFKVSKIFVLPSTSLRSLKDIILLTRGINIILIFEKRKGLGRLPSF